MTKKLFMAKMPYITAGGSFRGISEYCDRRNTQDGGAIYYNNGIASTFNYIPIECMRIMPYIDIYDANNNYLCHVELKRGRITVRYPYERNFGFNSSDFKLALAALFDNIEQLFGTRPHGKNIRACGTTLYSNYITD